MDNPPLFRSLSAPYPLPSSPNRTALLAANESPSATFFLPLVASSTPAATSRLRIKGLRRGSIQPLRPPPAPAKPRVVAAIIKQSGPPFILPPLLPNKFGNHTPTSFLSPTVSPNHAGQRRLRGLQAPFCLQRRFSPRVEQASQRLLRPSYGRQMGSCASLLAPVSTLYAPHNVLPAPVRILYDCFTFSFACKTTLALHVCD